MMSYEGARAVIKRVGARHIVLIMVAHLQETLKPMIELNTAILKMPTFEFSPRTMHDIFEPIIRELRGRADGFTLDGDSLYDLAIWSAARDHDMVGEKNEDGYHDAKPA